MILLKSQLFRTSPRIQRAMNFKFASLKRGLRDEAVQRLLIALSNIEEQSGTLPPELSAVFVSAEDELTSIGNWGPFNLDRTDFESATIGRATEEDIETFQLEARGLEADGKAGMNTIPQLDKIVAFLEARGSVRPFSG